MPPGPPELGNQARTKLVIKPASDGTDRRSGVATVVSVGLGDALVTRGAIQGIFNNNATARDSRVVSDIVVWTVFAARILTRRVGQWSHVLNALIDAVAAIA